MTSGHCQLCFTFHQVFITFKHHCILYLTGLTSLSLNSLHSHRSSRIWYFHLLSLQVFTNQCSSCYPWPGQLIALYFRPQQSLQRIHIENPNKQTEIDLNLVIRAASIDLYILPSLSLKHGVRYRIHIFSDIYPSLLFWHPKLEHGKCPFECSYWFQGYL